MNRKIIILSTHPLESNVMAAIRLRRLLPALAKEGWDASLIAPDKGEKQNPGPFERLAFVLKTIYRSLRLIERGRSAIVVSTIPAFESFAGGVILKAILRERVTLVLEVRDPFSLNNALPWSRFKRQVGRSIEGTFLRWPDRALFLTSEIERMYLNGFPNAGKWRTAHKVVTNGFDPAEFRAAAASPNQGRLVITYAGHFYDRRNPLGFLKALKEVLLQSPDLPAPRVQFVGELHGEALQREVKQLISTEPLRDCVQWYDSVSHAEAIRMLQNSDINLLITHDEGSEYAIPGKLFEYMGSGRPVLALTHDPLVEDIVRQTHLGWLCENADVLQKWFKSYLNNPALVRQHALDPVSIDRYNIAHIHKEWMKFMEDSVA